MSNFSFSTYPPIKIYKQVVKININCISLKLFDSAKFVVELIDNNDSVILSNIYELSGDDYLKWTDDKFIKDWIIEKLKDESS